MRPAWTHLFSETPGYGNQVLTGLSFLPLAEQAPVWEPTGAQTLGQPQLFFNLMLNPLCKFPPFHPVAVSIFLTFLVLICLGFDTNLMDFALFLSPNLYFCCVFSYSEFAFLFNILSYFSFISNLQFFYFPPFLHHCTHVFPLCPFILSFLSCFSEEPAGS